MCHKNYNINTLNMIEMYSIPVYALYSINNKIHQQLVHVDGQLFI